MSSISAANVSLRYTVLKVDILTIFQLVIGFFGYIPNGFQDASRRQGSESPGA